MRSVLAFLVLLLCACATLPVYVQGSGNADVEKHLEGIEDVWALEVQVVDSPKCAIRLHPTDEFGGIDCAGKDAAGCSMQWDIWCPEGADGVICAHEVGHSAGLEHVDGESDDPAIRANVMRPSVGKGNAHKTSRQQRKVRELAGTLNVCRRATE